MRNSKILTIRSLNKTFLKNVIQNTLGYNSKTCLPSMSETNKIPEKPSDTTSVRESCNESCKEFKNEKEKYSQSS